MAAVDMKHMYSMYVLDKRRYWLVLILSIWAVDIDFWLTGTGSDFGYKIMTVKPVVLMQGRILVDGIGILKEQIILSRCQE